MSYRDLIYQTSVAPTPATEYIRPLWYVFTSNDLYIWDEDANRYELYIPSVSVPLPPHASSVVAGILMLATVEEVLAGTDSTKAVTSQTLQTKLQTIVGNAPTALNTLAKLATALGNDPGFSQNVLAAIGTRAALDGTNVTTPSLSSNSLRLVNTRALQAAIADTAVTAQNIADARAQRIVVGATNSAGKQRFVTLPQLDNYVGLKERHLAPTIGGTLTTDLRVEDDVLLLDGASGQITVNVKRPSLYKHKPYRILAVNITTPPRLLFETGYPLIDGRLSVVFNTTSSLTLIPTSLGRWGF